MRSYLFAVNVDGVDTGDEDEIDTLMAEDEILLVADVDGIVEIDLEIEAMDPDAAVRAAVHLIEAALPGATVSRVSLDLVAAADIAERVGVSRQAVTNWAAGRRSGKQFPVPLGTLAGGTRVWSWSAVHPWLRELGHAPDDEETLPYETIVSMNSLLQRPRRPGRLATTGTWERPDLQISGGRRRFSASSSVSACAPVRFHIVGDPDSACAA